MEGWDRNANWNRDVLEHIAALLFALAGLADFAAGLPWRHRRQVLGILGHGEAEARAFVMGVATGAPDAPASADDAGRLAASFRALALALCALLAWAKQAAIPGIACSRAARCQRAERLERPAALPAPDTS